MLTLKRRRTMVYDCGSPGIPSLGNVEEGLGWEGRKEVNQRGKGVTTREVRGTKNLGKLLVHREFKKQS
jgi:hypothetical protein